MLNLNIYKFLIHFWECVEWHYDTGNDIIFNYAFSAIRLDTKISYCCNYVAEDLSLTFLSYHLEQDI